jgi:tetratricopeptide (TPR) repeat protein
MTTIRAGSMNRADTCERNRNADPADTRQAWRTMPRAADTLLKMSLILGYDPTTLRERVDLLEVGRRLDELGEMRSLDALSERAWLLKVTGRLDEAMDVANQALRLARFTGDRKDILRPRILRAQVLQYSAHFAEAAAELTACIDEAHTQGWRALESVALQHRGKVAFDQALYAEALEDFRASVALREKLGASQDQLESTLIAVAVTESFIDEQRKRG